MSAWILLLIYGAMLVFDAAILGGAAYLIGWRDWSAWWMLAAAFLAAGSNPKRLIHAWQGHKEEE